MFEFKILKNDELDLIDYYDKDNGDLKDRLYSEVLDEKQFTSVSTNNIFCIVGRSELFNILKTTIENDLKNYSIISLTEPFQTKSTELSLEVNCNDLLQLEFTDIRTERSEEYLKEHSTEIREISKSQILEIEKFIIKNKDTKFIISCDAGISRSAAVGVFLEKILNNNKDIKLIKEHHRYSPNTILLQKFDNHLNKN